MRLFAGLTGPKKPIIGSELAGVVEGMGKDAKQFKKGDQVFGAGVSSYAEYTCVKDGGSRAFETRQHDLRGSSHDSLRVIIRAAFS